MKRILVPTQSPVDWKRLLAKPDRHWKSGRSAMSAASSWESADGLPPEIRAALNSGPSELRDLDLVIAVPEWEVPLPGGATTSHTDVLAVATNASGLVIIAVEAKVDEPFGPTVGEKRAAASAGQHERLSYLHKVLGLGTPLPDAIRYQLVHRLASAVLTAAQFHARTAVMLVQSFSPDSRWFDDFEAFASAIGSVAAKDAVAKVPSVQSPALYMGWCRGDQRHRSAVLEGAV
ncbi:MAG: hypothetical protein IPN17_37065 [Deltaproteobacteria bacterium]|nr:hypothetical protein [Deltaproteobacteria bacterium]MBK8697715.1 hypothetical protein [Deltaproteobacteria bacterium]MBP6833067.1 hypothetical protein [Deltaproteobacteria bacterium]